MENLQQLNILREVIMGRELFDYAFICKPLEIQTSYSGRLFRTMEDASADLDGSLEGGFILLILWISV
jgi:hypothetical protein